jgi:ElaA protein
LIAVELSSFAGLDRLTLYRIMRLRAEVFVLEQECVYNDLDGFDTEPAAVHFWVDRDPAEPTVSAAARLLTSHDGQLAVLGRVATAPRWRGQGLATALVGAALAHVDPSLPVHLKAQVRLESWYARWGFERSGPDFLEDGIAHVPMVRGRP